MCDNGAIDTISHKFRRIGRELYGTMKNPYLSEPLLSPLIPVHTDSIFYW